MGIRQVNETEIRLKWHPYPKKRISEGKFVSPCDIEEIEYSLELPIGTRLYYKNRLLEVVESEEDKFRCLECALVTEFMDESGCRISSCFGFERHDRKRTIFKEVKETEEGV